MKHFLILTLFTPLLTAALPYPPALDGVRSEVYREASDAELRLWFFGDADPTKPKPAIVFFFGGGWTQGSPVQFEKQARHFAERGMIAMLADYRVKSRHGTLAVECVRDGKAAISWIRQNAGRLGIDPKRIAASGGSAGGHVAAATGTLPGFGSEERPNALILFNPVTTLAPLGALQQGNRRLTARLGVENSEDLSPAHHIDLQTPPTLILHGAEDTTVPLLNVEVFEAQMKKRERPCKLVVYAGAGHGFFNRGEHYTETLREADRFLVQLGWLRPASP